MENVTCGRRLRPSTAAADTDRVILRSHCSGSVTNSETCHALGLHRTKLIFAPLSRCQPMIQVYIAAHREKNKTTNGGCN